MQRSRTPSSVFLDDSGPRPLPSYLRQPPPPPPEEKALTCVPDVSLILPPYLDKTAATGQSSPVFNHMQPQPRPLATPVQKEASSNFQFRSREKESDGLLLELLNMLKQQSVKIDRIEDQLQSLAKSQAPKVVHCDIGIQTDEVLTTLKENDKKSSLNGANSKYYEMPKRNGMDKDITPNHTEDLSKILKELQLPITTEHSIYSVHNSSPHVDLPEFSEYNNDHLNKGEVENSPGIGPSVSEYGSSDEEEPEIQPTVTYYRNVLGNVNRILENQVTPPTRVPKHRSGNTKNGATPQEATNLANNNLMIQQNVYNSIFIPNPNGNGSKNHTDLPSRNYLPPEDRMPQWNTGNGNNDTTMYGMSTANLSFSTRDYLERHGLVYNEPPRQLPPMLTNGRRSNRVLDSVLQNQPKFL